MRIILLTQWFDPEPVPKGLGFAKEISAAGHEVEVVTGYPNYPGGKLYPGYRMSWRSCTMIDGVQVRRVPLYPSHDRSRLGRVLNYTSFFLSSLAYLLFGCKKPDVLYCYHPPLTSGLAATLASKLRGFPLVLDIQDMWPDTLSATGMINNSIVLNLVAKMCLWVYSRASAITVLSPGFKRLLIERGVPAEKITVIPNWCEESKICSDGILDVPKALASGFNVVFAGTLGKAQALDAVLDAARIVRAREPKVRFIFVGGGVDVQRLRARAADQDNVDFHPPVPMEQINAYLVHADVLVVHLKDDPLFAITIPSKTQAYMAVGRPILMAVRGDAARLIKEAGSGVTATPEDAFSIADSILNLVQLPPLERAAMGERGRRYYWENLSMKIGVGKYIHIFEEIIGVSRGY